MSKKIIVGNWKMNPKNALAAKKLFTDFRKQKINSKNVTTVICPPVQFVADLVKLNRNKKVFFGVQNVSAHSEGAHTGEISVAMVKDLGAKFVIVGHSERRALGESDEFISEKVKVALKAGLHVILAVGEVQRDNQGNHLRYLEQQVKNSLAGVTRPMLKKLIIAYEPVWAIGAGKKPMDSEEVYRMSLFVKKTLVELYGKKNGMSVPIIYGGSSNKSNAAELVYEGNVDGLLPGRASLSATEFAGMIDEVASYSPKK